ncbi:von Willebrand factor type A domain-containing protein [Geothermobacter ehrlichii]|uniref:von Willebrand factor type A domain-containing protein n=1 Tax=Geothermobacter ehrlichii TaxID=213224 RepID=A0A5D3WKC6_9BACT|nr:VWA domain-containing protein [Geothermobacter ehrlichii]TYO96753.1 von Willebrand factor type A domain-containing protein [Geothermobacter ehrlichii]
MNVASTLPVVAKAMGDKMGVRVVIGGGMARTDGDTIYLPTLPENDGEALLLARGFLDHEAGHVRMTDFSVDKGADPLLANLTNIIEDIRIEKGMGQLYPGCAVNLRNLANHLAAKGAFDFNPGEPDKLFLGWVVSRCRSRILRQEGLVPVFERTNQLLEPVIGPELLGKVARLLDGVGELLSTSDAHALARRILDLLRQEQQQDEPSGKSDESPSSDRQDQHPAENSPSDMDGENGEDAGQPDNRDRSSDGAETKDREKDSLSGERNGSPDGNQEQGNESVSDADTEAHSAGAESRQKRQDFLDQILNPSNTEEYGNIGEIVASELESRSEATSQETSCMVYAGDGDPEDYLDRPVDLHDVRRKTSALRARLGCLVQASRLKRSCAGRSGRRIDHRVLSRLPVGDTRIFRRQEEKTAVNTAVIILLDRSGSMAKRIALAADITLAVADAMNTIPGVAVATAAFPAAGHSVVVMTPFGMSPARTARNYGLSAVGGTPLHEALGWAAVQFATRQETRKVLLVVTDGQPNHTTLTRDYLKRLDAQGIELMALGISDGGACGRFFQNHRTINDITGLPNALFGMLQEALI